MWLDEVVGVVFENDEKVYYLDALDFNLKNNLTVVAKTDKGLFFVKVVSINEKNKDIIGKVVRVSSKKDYNDYKNNQKLAKEALNKCKIRHNHINKMQLIYFMLGIISIFLTLFIHIDVIDEIILIGGWVFIWSAIELEITSDYNELRKRKIIKKLLKSKMEEKEL